MPNAYREGEHAARSGVLETDNPYDEGTEEYNDWGEGYIGFQPMIKNQGKPTWQ